MLHSSTARFSHRPYHFAISVSFSTIKRDLAILTEWWQQRIAWWELLNAARQIICIRKQLTTHMEDDIKRILQDKQFHLQLKSEQKEIIQNVLERKDSMAVLPTGFGKSMCYVLPSHFGQGKIDHICKSSTMIHCGNRSFLEVTWQMVEKETVMAKW